MYVTLPIGQGSPVEPYFGEVRQSLGDPPAGEPPIGIIEEYVSDYLAEGQSEVIFKLNGRAPRNKNSDTYYAPSPRESRKEHEGELKIDIEVQDPADVEWKIMYRLAGGMSATEPWQHYGYTRRECYDKLRVPGSKIFIAYSTEEEKEPIGFALFDPRGFLDLPEIAYLWVNENCRGKGIGTRLMDEVVKYMPGNKMGNRLYLCVSSPNEDAQRLYKRYGFERVTSIPDYNVANEFEVVLVLHLNGEEAIELPSHFRAVDES